MNRYCSDQHMEEALYNARADVDLNKNLNVHYMELTSGIKELCELIKQERIVGNAVTIRKKLVVELLQFANEIKFKMQAFDGIIIESTDQIRLITDQTTLQSDFDNKEWIPYHIATLTYDIDNIIAISAAIDNKDLKLIEALSKMLEGLQQSKIILQAVLKHLD